MAVADLEHPDPKKANADRSQAHHRAEEEKQDQYQEDDVVDWEDLRRLNKDPVHGV